MMSFLESEDHEMKNHVCPVPILRSCGPMFVEEIGLVCVRKKREMVGRMKQKREEKN